MSKPKKNWCGILFGLWLYKIWIKENTILNTKNGDMMTIQTASETSGRNRKIEETFVQHDKRKNKRIKLGKCFKDDTSTPQWNWLKLVPASSGLFYFDTTAILFPVLDSNEVPRFMISAIAFFIWDVQPRPNVCILKQAAWVLEGTVFSEMKNNFYEMFQNEESD